MVATTAGDRISMKIHGRPDRASALDKTSTSQAMAGTHVTVPEEEVAVGRWWNIFHKYLFLKIISDNHLF